MIVRIQLCSLNTGKSSKFIVTVEDFTGFGSQSFSTGDKIYVT